MNYLFRDCERCFTKNIIVIASTHIFQKVNPALLDSNKLNISIKTPLDIRKSLKIKASTLEY